MSARPTYLDEPVAEPFASPLRPLWAPADLVEQWGSAYRLSMRSVAERGSWPPSPLALW